MLNEHIIIARKIQITIDSSDKEERSKHYQQLFAWQDLVYRGSNLVLTHQYIQENIKELIYLQDDVRVRLADASQDELGIFNTSRINTTYRVLSNYFKGNIPSDILSNLNMALTKTFNTDRAAYWKGEKSLRNFKKDMPIPFSAKQIKIHTKENSKDFAISLFKIPFRTYLGKDRSDKRALLQRVIMGKIKVCASSIKLIKGKIFLLLTLEIPRKTCNLNKKIVAEASLSAAFPIAVTVENKPFIIGSKEEFVYRRKAIQAARQRIQLATDFNKGGKGKKKKVKSMERYNEKERNYIDSRLHLYSRRLIDICVKTKAGTLLLANPVSEKESAEEPSFLLRSWTYYGFIEKIKYKAKMVGIVVIVE